MGIHYGQEHLAILPVTVPTQSLKTVKETMLQEDIYLIPMRILSRQIQMGIQSGQKQLVEMVKML